MIDTFENQKMWANRQTPLFIAPISRTLKHCDIPEKTVVLTTGNFMNGRTEVKYVTSIKTYTGWVYNEDLEDYFRQLGTNIVEISDQTIDPNDFEQYMIHKGVKQVNLCGPLCIADVTKNSLTIVLSKWELLLESHYKEVFKTKTARGLGPSELINLIKIFGLDSILLSDALFQNHIKRARYTISGLNHLLKNGQVICGVRINKYSGLLENKGILHWVNLKRIIPERNGLGIVTIYNPAMNCEEIYTYRDFILSAQIPYGVYIPNNKE